MWTVSLVLGLLCRNKQKTYCFIREDKQEKKMEASRLMDLFSCIHDGRYNYRPLLLLLVLLPVSHLSPCRTKYPTARKPAQQGHACEL
jgi:hypothetical protein